MSDLGAKQVQKGARGWWVLTWEPGGTEGAAAHGPPLRATSLILGPPTPAAGTRPLPLTTWPLAFWLRALPQWVPSPKKAVTTSCRLSLSMGKPARGWGCEPAGVRTVPSGVPPFTAEGGLPASLPVCYTH